ncbi:MAG: 50S ribosomal protein L11 [Candidatus Omnitrophota bacterium]|nr:MAG: 50S ribosomal protein L11 [Candidatus Omnitrophota bacterium]
MAKKKIKAIIKLYCPAGQANPAPPVGPALGQHGLKIMDFCKAFNEKTKGKEGLVLPVVITAYEDKSFTFIIKSPPGAVLLKQAANIAKASGVAGREKAGAVTKEEIKEIAKTKLKDLNTQNLEGAMKTVEGTARSMGIAVVETQEEKQKILAEVQAKVAAEEKAPAPAAKAPAEESKKKEDKDAKPK